MADVVTYHSKDHIATITINRPEALNALDEAVIQGLQQAWLRLQEGEDRCAILAAAGDRAFSVGADLKHPPAEMWQGVPGVGVEVDKPIIAAVKGFCVGGAYVIVQNCDLVVAADSTVFIYPEAQVGFTGGLIAGAAARLPHKVAMEFMLLGQRLGAERAYEVGMVNKLTPVGLEIEGAMEYARILAESAPLVVRTLKRFVNATVVPKSPSELSAIYRRDLLAVRNSADGAEGRKAFAEKRKPKFHGR
ncbi:MAG TPA: enoyl-CoA hydratase-related protein [Candidatus Sulfotelmatobacter sp.]|nr:enoyl-CoA hydratase-related protein [Candidatus Sulfotelmatobacter sp.]